MLIFKDYPNVKKDEASMRIGIDLGGTKIEGAALAANGREVARIRVATPIDDYGATVSAVAHMVAGLEREAGPARSVGVGIPGIDLAAAGIAERAADGDAEAAAALMRYEDRPARALAGVINILDPDVVVPGGGMSNVDRLYETIPRLWQGWVFSDRADTPLRKNLHGDSGGVRGAAWLWPAEEA